MKRLDGEGQAVFNAFLHQTLAADPDARAEFEQTERIRNYRPGQAEVPANGF